MGRDFESPSYLTVILGPVSVAVHAQGSRRRDNRDTQINKERQAMER